jgi:hypothetical protein
MEIIRNGYELVDYLYDNYYIDELKNLFEDYLVDIEGMNYFEIKRFFEKHPFEKYLKKINRKNWIDFKNYCYETYTTYFEGDPDYIKNNIENKIAPFVYLNYIDVILILNDYYDYNEYELDIIQKFFDKKYHRYFKIWNEDIPLKEFEKEYKYIILYRGGVGHKYNIYGYKPSIIKEKQYD